MTSNFVIAMQLTWMGDSFSFQSSQSSWHLLHRRVIRLFVLETHSLPSLNWRMLSTTWSIQRTLHYSHFQGIQEQLPTKELSALNPAPKYCQAAWTCVKGVRKHVSTSKGLYVQTTGELIYERERGGGGWQHTPCCLCPGATS